jgi:hypothetical protein
MARKHVISAATAVVVLLSSANAFALDLTGTWTGNDGSPFYLRQIGRVLWWFGENEPIGPVYSNVAHGSIAGNNINLRWADVPKGDNRGSGQLRIKITSDNSLLLISQTGPATFGVSSWTRDLE